MLLCSCGLGFKKPLLQKARLKRNKMLLTFEEIFFVKRQLFPQYSSSWTPKASLFCAASQGGKSKNLQDQLPPEVLWNLDCFSSFDKPPVEGAGPFQVLTCTNRYQKRQHNSGLCYYAEKKSRLPYMTLDLSHPVQPVALFEFGALVFISAIPTVLMTSRLL